MADNEVTAADCVEYPEDVDANEASITLAELDDAIEAHQAAYTADSSLGEIVIVDGLNVVVRVRSGCLELVDGVHPHRRTRIIARSDRHVQRVLVLGAGVVTTEAMLWCHQRGLPLVVARSRTEPTMMGAPALFDHAALRRAQALAPYVQTARGDSVAVTVTRWLLDQRLHDQARIAETMLGREDQAEAIHALRRALTAAHTIEDLLVVEGRGADRYWSCWESVELRFATTDRARVPDHWRRFRGRRSPLSANAWSNRHATTGCNALLNYNFRLAEVEATVACLALGLDPAMGQAHALRQGRPAASLDLMEAVRGVVEECVLTLINDRTLRKAWFFETTDGEIRLRPPLSHELAEVLLPILRESIAAPAERMASMVAEAAQGEVKVPSLLSSERRGKARQARRPKFAHACHGCGVVMPEHQRNRAWCDMCLPSAQFARGLSAVGPARRRKRPPRTNYANKQDYRRAESMAAVRAAEQEWEQQNQGMA